MQQRSLKALALLALGRNCNATSAQQPSENNTENPSTKGDAKAVPRNSRLIAILARLTAIADAQGVDPDLVRDLHAEDVDACAGLPDDVLRSYVRALADADLREHGKVPPDETARALCRSCGPVWVASEVAVVAPTVDGLPRLLGCAWCHVKNRKAMASPKVTCGTCRHFARDSINPSSGMGACNAGCNPVRPWPSVERNCESWRPQNGH